MAAQPKNPSAAREDKTSRASGSKTPRSTGAPKDASVKAALFDAALDVIVQDGAHKLSIREVARRAGVSHAAPYNHFANKNALLVALAAEGYVRQDRSMADAQTIASADPNEQLTAIGLGYVMFAVRNPELYALMTNNALCSREDVIDALPLEQSASTRLADAVVASRSAHGLSLDEYAVRCDCAVLWSLVHGMSDLLINRSFGDEVDPHDLTFVRSLLRRSLNMYATDIAPE